MKSQLPSTGGIVLCGGQSRRMGVAKQWLPCGQELMIQRVLRLLGEVVQPLVVVTAPGQELPELPPHTSVAHDQRHRAGPLEGIRVGLQHLAAHVEVAFVTACDVPLLEKNFVRRMFELLGHADVAVPVDDVGLHPLSAVYRTALADRIDNLLEAGQRRVADLFQQVDTHRVPVESLRAVDPELMTLHNLNSLEDYQRTARQMGWE